MLKIVIIIVLSRLSQVAVSETSGYNASGFKRLLDTVQRISIIDAMGKRRL